MCLFACMLQVVPMKFDPRDEDSIKAVMAKANVVINLIGSFCCLYYFALVIIIKTFEKQHFVNLTFWYDIYSNSQEESTRPEISVLRRRIIIYLRNLHWYVFES